MGTQTGELEPAWCRHTTKGESNPSKSVIVRRWSTLPRDFVIPGDRLSEDHFANGGFELLDAQGSRSMGGATYLRELMNSKRMKNAKMRQVTSRLMSKHSGFPPLKIAFRNWLMNAKDRRSVLDLLIPAAIKIASVTRWNHAFVPAPPAASAAKIGFGGQTSPGKVTACGDEELVFGYFGQKPRKLSMTQRIVLMHAVARWARNAAEELVTVRAELQWVGVRMRFGLLMEAWMRWKDEWKFQRFGDTQPDLTSADMEEELKEVAATAAVEHAGKSWSSLLTTVRSSLRLQANKPQKQQQKRFASPAFGSASEWSSPRRVGSPPSHGHEGYPSSINMTRGSQTERSWEWQTDVERRGGIHWPAKTVDVAVQTSRRSFVIAGGGSYQDTVGTQTNFVPTATNSVKVQTEYHAAYGELNFTRRQGRAAENKIVAFQAANQDPIVRRAVTAANARIAVKRAEAAQQEEQHALREMLAEKKSTTTWAYSVDDPKLRHRKHMALNQALSAGHSASSLHLVAKPAVTPQTRRILTSTSTGIQTPNARPRHLAVPSTCSVASLARTSSASTAALTPAFAATPSTRTDVFSNEPYESQQAAMFSEETEPFAQLSQLQSIAAVASAISADLGRLTASAERDADRGAEFGM